MSNYNEKSKKLLDELSKTEMHRAWSDLYGKAISLHPDNTITCCDCGETVLGDDPEIFVLCINCFAKEKSNG